ncbi:peptidyl-tRNA hydrolase II (PTH2) family protein [Tasmannia lanceolata]|uniref:peptidyl-tRNA hydrolase II (PTH2) family protein n=1 Tax=Tasmannia lanceolata TaxID=3420 RepID=UPI004064A1C6
MILRNLIPDFFLLYFRSRLLQMPPKLLPTRYLYNPAIYPPYHLTIRASFFIPTRSRVRVRVRVLQRCHSTQMSNNSIITNAAEGDEENRNSEVLVQYVVLRRDLIDYWPLGSIITQGCHASVAAIWMNRDDPHTSDYCSDRNLDSMHKVTLEVKGEPQILNLSQKLTSGGIAHKLWIEQPENIPTCLATKPYPKSVVSAFFKKLKLCK